MHTHSFAELYCFLGGEVIYHVEGTQYILNPGDILLMRPGEAHYAQVNKQVDYERISLHFDPKLLSALDPENVLIRPFFDRQAGTRNLYRADDDVCRQILFNMTTPMPEPRLNVLGNMILVLKRISDAFSIGQESGGTPDTLEYRLLSYINKHLEQELSLDKLCDRFFVSRTQLCRLFKQSRELRSETTSPQNECYWHRNCCYRAKRLQKFTVPAVIRNIPLFSGHILAILDIVLARNSVAAILFNPTPKFLWAE